VFTFVVLVQLVCFEQQRKVNAIEVIVPLCWYNFFYFNSVKFWKPITVTARSKEWTVFTRSNAGIVGSNPTQGMDVCVRIFCVCVVLCAGRGLVTGWSPVQGVLPTVYGLWNWKSGQGPHGLYSHR
jgi:hypothetical protein